MRKHYATLVDVTAYWAIAVLAYAVVGFLRGRELVRHRWGYIVNLLQRR